ncbi:hypothetical protein BC628DRAFT_1374456 [Trametes gibbosa]|nr:hypothetical protein BC628DRAFT_1374456 [Trametes gibbosa]
MCWRPCPLRAPRVQIASDRVSLWAQVLVVYTGRSLALDTRRRSVVSPGPDTTSAITSRHQNDRLEVCQDPRL